MSKMQLSKNSKILALLNFRLRITIQDGRMFVGQMIAFDKHMNLVLSECEEFRKIRPKAAPAAAGQAQPEKAPEREEKRTLGLVILRGETIVSISVESPPPVADDRMKGAGMAGGPGIGRPAGRGLPVAPMGMMGAPGLAGPMRGVGGPAPGMMAPGGRGAMGAPPVAYARPPMPMPPGGMPPGMRPAGFPPGPPPVGFRPGMPPPAGFPPGMPMPGAPPPGFRPPMPGAPPGFPPGFRPS